jgi:hypothetical protein
MEVRNDPWMSAFVIVALWCWTRYLGDGGARWAAFAGLAIGCATVFSQKTLPFAGLIAVGTMMAVARDRTLWARTARGAALVTGCAAVPVLGMVLAIRHAGYWSEFAFWNYTFNRQLYLEDARSNLSPSVLVTVGVSMAEAPLLWAAGIAGIGLAIRRPCLETTIPAVVVVGSLAALFGSTMPWGHYLLVVQAFLALLAVPVVDLALRSDRWRAAAATLVLLMVVKTAVLSTFYTEVPDGPKVQLAALEATRPDDRVAMPPPYHPIFRKDAFFFWVAPGLLMPPYLELCTRGRCPSGRPAEDARLWTESPPRAVFSPPDEPLWSPIGWQQHRSEYLATSTPGLWLRRESPAQASSKSR